MTRFTVPPLVPTASGLADRPPAGRTGPPRDGGQPAKPPSARADTVGSTAGTGTIAPTGGATEAAGSRGPLTCQLCGKPRRDLACHIRRMHALTVREYRALFQVPAGEPLTAAGPQPRSQATARRTTTVIARTEARDAAARAGLDTQAQQLGYHDMETLITATADLSTAEVGGMFGRSALWAGQWRRTFGVPARSTSAARPQRLTERHDRLPRLPAADQPARPTGPCDADHPRCDSTPSPRARSDAHGHTSHDCRARRGPSAAVPASPPDTPAEQPPVTGSKIESVAPRRHSPSQELTDRDHPAA